MRREGFGRALLALVLATGMWSYVLCVLIPYQKTQPARIAESGGNHSDLCPYYLGTRELLLHRLSPYTPELSMLNQQCYCGRVVNPNSPDFTYPPYVAFVLSPTLVFSDFRTARLAVGSFFVLLTVASVPLWMRAFCLKAKPGTGAIIALGMMATFPVVQGLLLQQLTMLEAGLIAACAAALASGRLGLAGTLLGLATFKPNLAWPVAAWLTVWGLSEWRQRRRFVISLGMTVLLLLIGAELILPGWFTRWWGVLHAYVESEKSQPLVLLLAGRAAGTVARYCLIAATAFVCWARRREPAGSPGFNWAFALVLATNVLTTPVWHTYDQVLLLPAVLFLLFYWRRGLKNASLARPVYLLAIVAGAWGPLAAIALVVTSMVSQAAAFRWYWAPLASVFTFPLAVLIALGVAGSGLLFHAQEAREVSPAATAAAS